MIRLQILSDKHLEKLTSESAITDEVIKARGYKTINNRSDLADYGFGTVQRRAPALLIPVHGPDGSNTLFQIRPDVPRRKAGKTLKYEMPAGAKMRIDCPPDCRTMMGDPSVTLWVTEGVLKGDSLASHGLCAISLLGVWNFKATNDFGGVTISVDFDSIAFQGRTVRIVFDSDVMNKPTVRKALERLIEILERKGAAVTAVYLPADQDGSKVGVDDYLRDHSAAELEALVTTPRILPRPAPATIELLDSAPEVMHRPLQIIGGRAYIATWLHIRIKETEGMDKEGNIVRYDPPKVMDERRMFIMRDDGALFGEGGDRPFSDLGFEHRLNEPLQDRVTMSKKSVEHYRDKKMEPIGKLFDDIVSSFDKFLDFDGSLADQHTMAEMSACFAIATWFLEGFNVAGYIYPTGPAGSGKTQYLSLMCQVAYLGEFVQASGSFAAIRDLSNYGAFLGFDDAENVTNRNFDPDKRNILLSGTKRGSQVTLKEPDPNGRGWITRYVNTFAFRGFSAINSPDPTLGSRTITVPLIRTANKKKGDSDPLDVDLWPVRPDDIRSHAWQIALKYLSEMPSFERVAKAEASLTGRTLEPWSGILSVAALIESKAEMKGLFLRMNALSVAYQALRQNIEAADLTILVLRSIAFVICPTALEPFEINQLFPAESPRACSVTTADITSMAHILIRADDLDFNIEEINSRVVGRAIGKLRMEKTSDGSKRGWNIKATNLEKQFKAYSLLVGKRAMADVSDIDYISDVNSSSGEDDNPQNTTAMNRAVQSASQNHLQNVSNVKNVNNVTSDRNFAYKVSVFDDCDRVLPDIDYE